MSLHPITLDQTIIRAILQDRVSLLILPVKKYPDINDFNVGDQLWARERWRIGAWKWPYKTEDDTGRIAVDYADGPRCAWNLVNDDREFEKFAVECVEDADGSGRGDIYGGFEWEPGDSPCRWRKPKTMPRWASRITMEVGEISVTSVQKITNEQAIAAGVRRFDGIPLGKYASDNMRWSMGSPSTTDPCLGCAWAAFGNYFIRQYGDVVHSVWDKDPAVFLVGVKRVEVAK
ncbi:MAG: hypothetical protein HQM00_05530 [Magnetococcales bacterium]|nr:hypothetical protein [Magnetococcales bacterium]